MSDNDELVSRFADIAGVDIERARFYLELSGWQLEVALASYYEERDSNPEEEEIFQDAVASSDSSKRASPTQQETKSPSKASAKSSSNSRFATVASLNKDTSSDEEEGQAFYAGGSENSGQQVLGPGKKKSNIVAEMFRSAQEHGADIIDPNEATSSRRVATFSGTGYRLGQSSNDTEVVGSPVANQSSSHQEYAVTLKMWCEGFSINDGPLRRYSEPESKEFLATVGRGEVPDELIREARGNEVHLNMEDHSHDEYVPVKPKLKPFTGKGNVLGSPAPNTVIVPTSTSDQDKSSNEEKAKSTINVNPSEPTTTVQVRLADGSRLVATFNQTHTVADIRNYISIARPEYRDRNFNLLTTFPSKELSDNTSTLAEAGLLNAAILQRLT